MEPNQVNNSAPQSTPNQPAQTGQTAPTTPPTEQQNQQGSSPKKPLPRKVVLIAAGILLLIIVVVLGMVIGGSAEQKVDTTNKTTTSTAPTTTIEKIETTPQAPNAQNPSQIMVYGAWTGQTSVVKAVDLGSSNSFLVATLPLEVKKVSVLSAQNLMFIDQIDTKDHGKRITVYDIKSKTSTFSIQASQGYGIDDYVLSPDKKYLAIWEVSFVNGSSVLLGGKSRVYAVDLSRPTVKNLLYDETSSLTAPIHYPRAILNNGTVFTDTFMPNDPKGGTGWAYGMSVVDFDGTNKRDIDTMKAGSYGTQPSLSPDGKYLLFAGYDGARGDGNAVNSGYRQALLTPNTVDLLNTQTLQRFKLPNLVNTNTYTAVDWEVQTGNVMMTVLSPEKDQTGVYSYDLGARTPTKIAIPSPDNAEYGYLSKLNESKALIGLQDTSPSNLGNLGENYAYAFTQLALLDIPSQKVNFISLQDTFAQYITLLPTNYFQTVLGVKTIAQAVPEPTFIDMFSNQNKEKENLQLYTFFLKGDLSPQRLKQQSTPITNIEVPVPPNLTLPPGITIPPGITLVPGKDSPTCEQLAEQQCTAAGVQANTEAYEDCVKTNKNHNKVTLKLEGKCHDSPLYLYGPAGTSVRVKIQTPIYNAVPASSGEYAVTLGNAGNMFINDKAYKSIAYDYQSNARRIVAPTRGKVVTKADVGKVVREYAKKLGLNEKETNDVVAAGQKKVTTPYAFVSFFNHEQSQQILPITFSPQPNNYLNVVFYFKLYTEKPSFIPAAPLFGEPVKRTGLTAVEVSEMVE